MKKRILCSLTVVAFVLMLAGCSQKASKSSQGLSFFSNGDGTCTWVGIGDCKDMEIVVPETNSHGEKVAVIGDGEQSVLNTDTEIISVSLPDTVIKLADNAFCEAEFLQKVEMQEGIKSIGDSAFYKCTSLSEVYVPDTVLKIANNAFFACNNLKKIHLSESLTEICDFSGCYKLEEVNIPKYLTCVTSDAFAEANIKKVEINMDVISAVVYETNQKLIYDGSGGSEIINDMHFAVQVYAEEGYPYQIKESNRGDILCNLFGKKEVRVNDKTYKITSSQNADGRFSGEFFGETLIVNIDNGEKTITFETTSESLKTYQGKKISYEYDFDTNDLVGMLDDKEIRIEYLLGKIALMHGDVYAVFEQID